MDNTIATRVMLSYRAPAVGVRPSADAEWILQDSGWIKESLEEPAYRRFIQVAHAGPVSVGDEFDEFVNCGCASPIDVILRVEAVERGTAIGPETTIEFVPRRELLDKTEDPIARA